MKQLEAVVRSRHGLHSRNAAKICTQSKAYKDTNVMIVDPDTNEKVDARSILSIMGLLKVTGDHVLVVAKGRQEEEAAKTVASIIEKFDVPETCDCSHG